MAKKYIDADRLKAEIKRRRLHFNKEAEKYQALNNGYSQNCYGARDALRDLENFLDSLQQEQEKENVEKVCGTCTHWQEGTLDRGMCQAEEPHQTHSAETCERWERHDEIPMEEQPSGDLEEAAEKFVYDWAGLSPTERRIAERAYLAGAEWQEKQDLRWAGEIHKNGYNLCKEQMLKDAVEGFIFQSADYYPKQLIAGYDGELGMGDKVKIVIIPEKEEQE